MKNSTFLFSSLFFSAITIYAQQHTPEGPFHPEHSLGLVVSHTQIPEGIKPNGRKKWVSLPSWGLNYNYKFTPQWTIGLHNDIIVEDFKVEHSGSQAVLERSYPIAMAIMTSYKPGKHFSFMLGPGGEFASGKNFFLIRAGIEYGWQISHDWELNASLTNDYKANAYNSLAIGLGIAKIF